MQDKVHGLIICNRIYPVDQLGDLCENMLADKSVPAWEREIYTFISEWIDEKDYILQVSSGTTGTPKELKLPKASMAKAASNTLLCLPVEYIAGKMMIVRALVGGLNLLITEPSSMPDLTGYGKVDFCAMVPLQVFNSLNTVETLRRIKKLIIGGAEIRDELEVILRDLPNEVYATYGMAESFSHVAIRRINGAEHERNYHAVPGIKFSIDERGCLAIEADYLDKKIQTNDVVDLSDSSTFRWIGRYDNLINSGGVKIVPEEVEAVISKVTGLDCAVIGVPDTKLGEKVVLVVERGGSEISEQELQASIMNELPKKMQPKEIIFIDELPRNHSYKVDRLKLKDSIGVKRHKAKDTSTQRSGKRHN
jgi:O-succinylbenzoic acid--CoA ligase